MESWCLYYCRYRKTQFYIYAENNNAGLFSPRRAEFEYHVIEANDLIADIQAGELVLNEFMSSNQSTVKDPSDDKYEDWLEIYNNSNRTLDLSGLNLTDDIHNIQKYEFPAGITLASKNRMMLCWMKIVRHPQNFMLILSFLHPEKL